MDNKNVFVAIALSMSVLLFWGAFFETPRKTAEQNTAQQVEQSDNKSSIAPAINQPIIIKKVTREEAINKSKRITIENENVVGSLSLEGALIDDISFKKHKQKVVDGENTVFLYPSKTENGFFIETGWTSIGNKIKVPSNSSTWTVKGNNTLTEKSPVIIQWDNNEGIIFEKKNRA